MYCVIRRCPSSPSFWSAWSDGNTGVMTWRMIEAVMYGMIPSAKTPRRASPPPENTDRRPKMPPWFLSASDSASEFTPGAGMYDPNR